MSNIEYMYWNITSAAVSLCKLGSSKVKILANNMCQHNKEVDLEILVIALRTSLSVFWNFIFK